MKIPNNTTEKAIRIIMTILPLLLLLFVIIYAARQNAMQEVQLSDFSQAQSKGASTFASLSEVAEELAVEAEPVTGVESESEAELVTGVESESKAELVAGTGFAEGTELAIEAEVVIDAELVTRDELAVGTEQISESEEEDPLEEYGNFAIAQVNKYVNVRKEPNTDSAIVGKMYNGAVAEILEVAGEEKDWFKVESGEVEGYIKSEYFLSGAEALEAMEEYMDVYATIRVTRLNVREQPESSTKKIGFVNHGEQVKVLGVITDATAAPEELVTTNIVPYTTGALLTEMSEGDIHVWLKVQYTEEKVGYIAARYATVSESFKYAKSIEEEERERAAMAALAARKAKDKGSEGENTSYAGITANTNYSTNAELRQSIVDYSMQYLGNRYVHGGKSLEGGTDCSGFTCYIYAAYGYSISRTPSGQLSSAGRSISMDEIQPGDIICYGKKKCTHVALYIGNGQIIHEANKKKGVVIYDNIYYDNVLGIKNVID